MAHAEGTLYLLPVWLGEAGGIELLPPANVELAARLSLYFAERERTARHMLRRMVPAIDPGRIDVHRLDQDSSPSDIAHYVHLLRTRDGAVISEAGMPAIADPGARLVAAAHDAGIRVVPLTGPSSIVLALAASGLNGQHFTFHGYLPREQAPRREALRRLAGEARRTGAAQVFMETPYRNDALLAEVLRSIPDGLRLCLAYNIQQEDEHVVTRPVAAWRLRPPMIGKRPCIFVLGMPAR